MSVLNIDIEPEPFTLPLTSNDGEILSKSPTNPGSLEGEIAGKGSKDNDNIIQDDNNYCPHRLSILTNAGSERASTLIGSDDDLGGGTENNFDSVRTRVNEGVTPVRVESIFDLGSSSPDMSSTLALKKNREGSYVDEINVSPTSDMFRGLTPPPVKVEGWLSNRQDDIDWGSDWESTKNPRSEKVSLSHGSTGKVCRRSESSAAILKSSLRDNDSRSSFEDWTAEWGNDDGFSSLGTSPANRRVKTAFVKGKSASSKGGPGISHSRSQSLPVRTTRHSEFKKPLYIPM